MEISIDLDLEPVPHPSRRREGDPPSEGSVVLSASNDGQESRWIQTWPAPAWPVGRVFVLPARPTPGSPGRSLPLPCVHSKLAVSSVQGVRPYQSPVDERGYQRSDRHSTWLGPKTPVSMVMTACKLGLYPGSDPAIVCFREVSGVVRHLDRFRIRIEGGRLDNPGRCSNLEVNQPKYYGRYHYYEYGSVRPGTEIRHS